MILLQNFLMSLTVKEFWKSVNIWRSCEQEYSVLFFDSERIETASVFEKTCAKTQKRHICAFCITYEMQNVLSVRREWASSFLTAHQHIRAGSVSVFGFWSVFQKSVSVSVFGFPHEPTIAYRITQSLAPYALPFPPNGVWALEFALEIAAIRDSDIVAIDNL